jgi:hypothetical protein
MIAQPRFDEIDRDGLTETHLIEIAKCVISWGQLEGHLRALLTGLEGRPLTSGAKDHFSLSPDDAWKKIKKKMRADGLGEDALKPIQTFRDHCKKYYKTRKTIVHCGCVGVWKIDPDYIAFSAFEKFSETDLALYFVPLDEMRLSREYAQSGAEFAFKLLKIIGY